MIGEVRLLLFRKSVYIPCYQISDMLSLSVRVMHPGVTLATGSSFHKFTGERRSDMILKQNISTIHVLCVGCTVEPARRFFSARRSQLQTLARSSHGGETGERGLALVGRCCCCSSCKVPFFHTGKGRSHPNTSLNMDKAF